MGIKSILVVAGGSAGDALRLKEAFVLAKHHGATIVALYVTGASNPANPRSCAERDSSAEAAELAAKALAKRDGIILEWRQEAGDAVVHAATYAINCDLAIAEPSVAQRLVFTSAAPVLAFPDGAVPCLPRSALIAWNASREASRAVRDAVPLVSSASTIDVVAVDPPSNRSAATYLGRALAHSDLRIRIHERISHGRHPGDLLLEEASVLKADLLVMGAYGHARVHDWVLGGVTEKVLKNCRIPFMLSH
jgi:nucleotide-binding universal stress UspA family protein